MAKGRPVRVNRSRPHKVGNRYLSDYDLGWDLWYAHRALPLTASLATQQGYVKAAKSADKCLVSSMRCAERKGLFLFLPKWAHISRHSGNSLSVGAESRLSVRIARASVAQVKATQEQRGEMY